MLPIEGLLAELVERPTLSNNVASTNDAMDHLTAYFFSCGLYVERIRYADRSTLVASSQRHNKRPKVMLAAHVDVVPADETMFTLRREGDKLIGRGVYDMKFAIAGYMQLAKELQHELADYDFAIAITPDEEPNNLTTGNGTQELLQAGYKPDVCVLPDSTAPGWDIEKSAKGHWRFRLIADGKAAHGSRPWEGESASFKLLQGLYQLEQAFKRHGPLTDTLNIGVLEGGETFNQIPVEMKAWVEIRLAADDSLAKNEKLLADICRQHGLRTETFSMKPLIHQNIHHSLVLDYIDSVEEITGKRPRGFLSLGGSDAGFFLEHGIPCILSCPEGGGHHSGQEWISRTSLLQFVPILRDYLTRVARQPVHERNDKDVDTAAILV